MLLIMKDFRNHLEKCTNKFEQFQLFIKPPAQLEGNNRNDSNKLVELQRNY